MDTISIRTTYPDYRKSTEKPVNRETYALIAGMFNEKLKDAVIQGKEVRLPKGLGKLRVQGYIPKRKVNEETGEITGLPIDWKSTKALWEKNLSDKQAKTKIYYLNTHTGGYTYKIVWDKAFAPLKYKRFYSFSAMRGFKNSVAQKILIGDYNYKKI